MFSYDQGITQIPFITDDKNLNKPIFKTNEKKSKNDEYKITNWELRMQIRQVKNIKDNKIGPKRIKNEPNYIELEKDIYLSKSVNSDFWIKQCFEKLKKNYNKYCYQLRTWIQTRWIPNHVIII